MSDICSSSFLWPWWVPSCAVQTPASVHHYKPKQKILPDHRRSSDDLECWWVYYLVMFSLVLTARSTILCHSLKIGVVKLTLVGPCGKKFHEVMYLHQKLYYLCDSTSSSLLLRRKEVFWGHFLMLLATEDIKLVRKHPGCKAADLPGLCSCESTKSVGDGTWGV